jgi:hypothetical protein
MGTPQIDMMEKIKASMSGHEPPLGGYGSSFSYSVTPSGVRVTITSPYYEGDKQSVVVLGFRGEEMIVEGQDDTYEPEHLADLLGDMLQG